MTGDYYFIFHNYIINTVLKKTLTELRVRIHAKYLPPPISILFEIFLRICFYVTFMIIAYSESDFFAFYGLLLEILKG